jgi:hypothetical protein
MNRSLLNLVLAGVLVALGVAVYFSQKKEEKFPSLTPLTAETINTIAIEHPGAPAIKLKKQNGNWMLTAPVRVEADKFEVNGALALATLEQKKTIALSQIKLADLGLETPEYTVTLNDIRLQVGGMEPLQYQRYIKVTSAAGEQIALTDDPPSAALDKDYSDLVSKVLLPANAEIQKIEVPGLTVTRDAEGKWQLTPPDPKATTDAIQKFVDSWKNARAMWNELEEKKDTAGEPVTITLKDRTLKFIVAGRDPQLQFVRPDVGVRFHLSKALADEMLKLPEPDKAEKKEEPGAAVE